MRSCNAGNTVDGIARKRKDLALGQEQVHPSCSLRCLANAGRRLRQGWRFVRLAGGPGRVGKQDSCFSLRHKVGKSKPTDVFK